MKTYNPYFKNKYDIWIYIILIISSSLAALLAVNNIIISPDSMRFGLISQQILSGHGISVPIIRLEDNYVPVNGAVPFLDQMPLFPMLLALMGGVTSQNYAPAQIINVISHVAITVFTFLIMKHLYGNKGIALLTGMLVALSFPLLWDAHHILSESLFLSLTTATIFFLILSRHSDSPHSRKNLLIAGICASAAIFTRNAGIALIAVFCWELFVLIKQKKLKSRYEIYVTVAAILLPLIATLGMFIRNYIISGTLRGFVQRSPERSYIDAFTGTIKMIFQQFQLGNSAIILSILFIAFFILYYLISVHLRKGVLKYLASGLDSIIVFMLAYTTLIFIAMAKQQWNFELRYVHTLVPFLFISSMVMIISVWDSVSFTRFSKLSLVGLILSVGLISYVNLHTTYFSLSEFFYKQEVSRKGQYFLLHSCAFKWLREHYDKNSMITTNKPYHLSFFGGYSTVGLPHKRFNPTIFIPDDMETVLPNRMSKFGSRILVLFESAEERYDGSYIAKLFTQRENDLNFKLEHECEDGVIYNLRE